MKAEIRTFVAIKINADKKLLDQQKSFKTVFKNERINWVDDDNFHLTLRFLGNTTREQLYELVDRMELIAGATPSFQFELKGVGYFKRKGQPQVLFAKIVPSKLLSDLVAEVEKNVVATGFLKELKDFRPHLTLGRIKHLENTKRFYTLVDAHAETAFQNVNIAEFILYKSILRPEGPIYKTIQKFKLK